MLGEMYLARRGFGDARAKVYTVAIARLPTQWRFNPPDYDLNGESTSARDFCIRQPGIAALDFTAAAALARLELVA